MTVVESHADYEARNPDEREYAEQFEQKRRIDWITAHGSDDGYQPHREFPCPGTLRIVDQNETHRTIACDGCTFVTTAPATLRVGQEAW